MSLVAILGIVGLGLLSGLLIGCVGVGGVIIVPALAYLAGYPVHAAIPAAMAAYLVAGLVGSFAYWRAGSVPWRMAQPLCLGAMPAALAGALVSTAAPAGLLEALIGLLATISGLNVLMTGLGERADQATTLSSNQLLLAGAVTGFASALSGTGGPLVLVPILMWLACPALEAVGMALVIQLPIAVLATAGNLWVGTVDLPLAAPLGVGLAVGTWGGAQIAHAVPRATLRRIVAVVLASVGVVIVVKVAMRLAA